LALQLATLGLVARATTDEETINQLITLSYWTEKIIDQRSPQ